MPERLEPTASRAAFDPAYGASDAEALLEWSWAREQLERSRNFWIATTRPDGRPHAMPVWGAFVDDRVVFGTARASRKARNIAERADVVVHAESGDEVVIVEGAAVETQDRELLRQAADVFEAKYDWRPDLEDFAGTAWFVVEPRVAYAWLERDYVNTRTRFVF